jgi:hypothetical protein
LANVESAGLCRCGLRFQSVHAISV